MQMKSRMAVKPCFHSRMFVSPIVVHDQVKIQLRGRLDIDPFEKSNELLMPMPRHAITDNPSIQHA
jgi:hypothetical protein